MEITQEEDTILYIYFSKKRIDEYIVKKEYQLAFQYLIFVLERLDENNKKEFINYYRKKITNISPNIHSQSAATL